mmetsp:Transcript_16110/g.39690  ORF Transcript_16110/g.39690 Transcript_16110/m.39690 type:complete len:109 (+) Transcript_16110:1165-1491(+)
MVPLPSPSSPPPRWLLRLVMQFIRSLPSRPQQTCSEMPLTIIDRLAVISVVLLHLPNLAIVTDTVCREYIIKHLHWMQASASEIEGFKPGCLELHISMGKEGNETRMR